MRRRQRPVFNSYWDLSLLSKAILYTLSEFRQRYVRTLACVFIYIFSSQKNELEKPDIYSRMEHVSEGFHKKLICAKTKTLAKDKKY